MMLGLSFRFFYNQSERRSRCDMIGARQSVATPNFCDLRLKTT